MAPTQPPDPPTAAKPLEVDAAVAAGLLDPSRELDAGEVEELRERWASVRHLGLDGESVHTGTPWLCEVCGPEYRQRVHGEEAHDVLE